MQDRESTTGKLFLDDLQVGDRWVSEMRELTHQDVRAFAKLTGDLNPLHLDPDYAGKTPFRRPIAHGLLTMAISAGLGSIAPELHEVVLVSIEDWRFCRPVYPGDRLYLVNEVTSIDGVTRRRGQVTWLRQLYNHEGDLVQSGLFKTLVAARTGRRVLNSAETEYVTSVDELPAYPR